MSRSCQLLRCKVRVTQALESIEKDIKSLDERKRWLKEELTCVSQWIDILNDSQKEYFFEKDITKWGLTVSKRIQLLQNDQKTILEKHQSLEEKYELNLLKKENFELQYELLTMQENNMYDLLI